jgi:hypothetical protein
VFQRKSPHPAERSLFTFRQRQGISFLDKKAAAALLRSSFFNPLFKFKYSYAISWPKKVHGDDSTREEARQGHGGHRRPGASSLLSRPARSPGCVVLVVLWRCSAHPRARSSPSIPPPCRPRTTQVNTNFFALATKADIVIFQYDVVITPGEERRPRKYVSSRSFFFFFFVDRPWSRRTRSLSSFPLVAPGTLILSNPPAPCLSLYSAGSVWPFFLK